MFNFNLLENEKLIGIYRQTEGVLFKPVIIVLALIYFPWYFLIKYELAAKYDRLLLFWTLLIFLYAANKYLLWLLNLYLVTDKRLIQVSYKNLVNKTVLESPQDKILNISFTSKGLWQSLFKVGSVEVQASGLRQPMVLKNLKDPADVKDFLWKIYTHYGQNVLSKQPPEA